MSRGAGLPTAPFGPPKLAPRRKLDERRRTTSAPAAPS